MQDWQFKSDQFHINTNDVLGQGGFATVYTGNEKKKKKCTCTCIKLKVEFHLYIIITFCLNLGMLLEYDHKIAVKKLNGIKSLSGTATTKFIDEMNNTVNMNHPNIVNVIGACMDVGNYCVVRICMYVCMYVCVNNTS
jgi:serine/threonine protein kinase